MTEIDSGDKGFILVSGATSGIGLATAKLALDEGYHLIACCYPDVEAGAALKRYRVERVSLLVTDVTSEGSVGSTLEQVEKLVGSAGLKGLVNSAGVATLCPAELISVAEFRQTLDVNIVGTFSMCRAALPLLRRGGGTIVNISSDAGLLGMPTGAAYCASKFAVEAFSDSLRAEVRVQGVNVVVVEPGNIDTPIWEIFQAPLKAKYVKLDESELHLYGDYFRSLMAIKGVGIPVERVAKVIVYALSSRKPGTRYRVGSDAHFTWLVAKLPARARDWLANKIVKSYATEGGLPRPSEHIEKGE